MQKKITSIVIFLAMLPLVSVAQISANFTTSRTPDLYCTGEKVEFKNNSTGQTYQRWEFDDGNETYFEEPEHIYDTAGIYEVTLTTYDDAGNSENFSSNIEIIAMPQLLLQPSGEIEIKFGQAVNAEATGSYSTLNWKDGSSEETRIITRTGTYTVTVANLAGCTTSDSLVVTVLTQEGQLPENFEIEVLNNILTPNGDGFNDYLFIDNLDEFEYSCKAEVFNVYGNKVYSSENYQNNWNGEQNGKNLPSGTYYYILTSQDRKGGSGYIDILRNE